MNEVFITIPKKDYDDLMCYKTNITNDTVRIDTYYLTSPFGEIKTEIISLKDAEIKIDNELRKSQAAARSKVILQAAEIKELIAQIKSKEFFIKKPWYKFRFCNSPITDRTDPKNPPSAE